MQQRYCKKNTELDKESLSKSKIYTISNASEKKIEGMLIYLGFRREEVKNVGKRSNEGAFFFIDANYTFRKYHNNEHFARVFIASRYKQVFYDELLLFSQEQQRKETYGASETKCNHHKNKCNACKYRELCCKMINLMKQNELKDE